MNKSYTELIMALYECSNVIEMSVRKKGKCMFYDDDDDKQRNIL